MLRKSLVINLIFSIASTVAFMTVVPSPMDALRAAAGGLASMVSSEPLLSPILHRTLMMRSE